MTVTSVELQGLFRDRDVMVDFDEHPPITYIFGENGSGKSTLLKLLAVVFDPLLRSDLMYNFDLESALITFTKGQTLSIVWERAEEVSASSDKRRSFNTHFNPLKQGSKVHLALNVDGAVHNGRLAPPDDEILGPLLRRQVQIHMREQGEEPSSDLMARWISKESEANIFEHDWDPALSEFLSSYQSLLISTERLVREETSSSFVSIEKAGRLNRSNASAVENVSKKIGSYIEREVANQGRLNRDGNLGH